MEDVNTPKGKDSACVWHGDGEGRESVTAGVLLPTACCRAYRLGFL
jgi:hypothetical protein